jgi:hypothetical protein
MNTCRMGLGMIGKVPCNYNFLLFVVVMILAVLQYRRILIGLEHVAVLAYTLLI